MANIPSRKQLQDDPFGFHDRYEKSAKPKNPGFSDTAFPTPSEYGKQVRQYDAGRPTARSESKLGSRVVPRGGQVFDPSFDAKVNLAAIRSALRKQLRTQASNRYPQLFKEAALDGTDERL